MGKDNDRRDVADKHSQHVLQSKGYSLHQRHLAVKLIKCVVLHVVLFVAYSDFNFVSLGISEGCSRNFMVCVSQSIASMMAMLSR